MNANPKSRLFVSYSHKDTKYLEDFKRWTGLLTLEKRVELWSDEDITPGDTWREAIASAIDRADIAVLLVSQDFLTSRFINEKELPPILNAARDKRRDLRVVWICLSPCLYGKTDIAAYQCANDPAKPLSRLTKADRDQAWKEIALTFHELAQEIAEVRKEKSDGSGDGEVKIASYYLHMSVYPNGYGLFHRKLRVEVRGGRTLEHTFYLVPEGDGGQFQMPTFRELERNARRRSGTPYPSHPFMAFASEDEAVTYRAIRPSSGRRLRGQRAFEVEFPRKGEFTYQWIWGAPYHFDPADPRPMWQYIKVGQRFVDEVRIKLRVHNLISGRIRPGWLPVDPSVGLDLSEGGQVDVLEMQLDDSRRGPDEFTPLFQCYEYRVSLDPGYDIVVLY